MHKECAICHKLLTVENLAALGHDYVNKVCTRCGDRIVTPIIDNGEHTYRMHTVFSPSNWNELTYQDNNDTQIMNYIGSSFFSYDFKFENGKIVPGEFEIKYDAATKLEDVSSQVDAKWGIPAGATARAYKITLREGLMWQDGTPIKAEDFVYSMKEQLNPDFKNYRADSFYVGATIIHNAENYVKQGSYGYRLMIPNAAAEEYVAFAADSIGGFQVSSDGYLQVVQNGVTKDVVININDGAAWSSNALPESKRLQLIAALEKEVLSVYYTVPLYNDYSASLISYKIEYVTRDYNTFMAYGGIKYITYNYTDAKWTEYVEKTGGTIDYK